MRMGGQQADVKDRGYLDFDDFRGFVKLLKGRPEIDRLYKKLIRLKNEEEGVFDFKTFEYFMREVQKVCVYMRRSGRRNADRFFSLDFRM